MKYIFIINIINYIYIYNIYLNHLFYLIIINFDI